MLSRVSILVQRAACDAYGIIVNVLTSDQHNWCVPPFPLQCSEALTVPLGWGQRRTSCGFVVVPSAFIPDSALSALRARQLA